MDGATWYCLLFFFSSNSLPSSATAIRSNPHSLRSQSQAKHSPCLRQPYHPQSKPRTQSTDRPTDSSTTSPVSTIQIPFDQHHTNPPPPPRTTQLNTNPTPAQPINQPTNSPQPQPQPCANSTPTRTRAATPRRSSPPSARPQLSCSAPAPAAKSGQRSRWRWTARLAAPPTMATSIAVWRWRVGDDLLVVLLLGVRGLLLGVGRRRGDERGEVRLSWGCGGVVGW